MIDNDKFFPIRYEKSRHFIPKLQNLCRSLSSKEILSDEFQEKIHNLLFEEMALSEQSYPPPVYVSEQSFNLKFSRELNFFWFYNIWYNNGKNIFHFSKELLELFENTDVDEIPLEVIQFPFKSFYISFEDLDRQFAIDTLGNDYYIDGVLVVKDFAKENQIDLFINGYVKSTKFSMNWLWNDYASLSGDWFRINYTKDLNTLKTAGYLSKFLIDNRNEVTEEATKLFFAEVINLVINALCYLSSKQETPIRKFPKDTPKHLLDKLENAKTRHQKDIILTDIKSKGYSKVNFLGESFKNIVTQESENGKSISTHWRRGFWRNQAFGEGFKEHILKWIKPTVVNKEKGDSQKGRIYNV